MVIHQRFARRRSSDAGVFLAAWLLHLVGIAAQIPINGLMAWVILEQFEYSMPFWNYVWIGLALTILLYDSKE